MAAKRRPRTTARADVVPFPARKRPEPQAVRWLPSTRSILSGLALLLAAAAVYLIARETSVFAVRTIEVRGASPTVAARVRSALEPLLGTSLVGFSRDAADRGLYALPQIAGASYDRDFPHTLRVFVRVEQPAAVLRRGAEAWLVSSRARVVRLLAVRPYPPLPRIWIDRTVDVSEGATLTGYPAQAARAAAVVERIRVPGSIRLIRASEQELTFVLASGREIRLGDAGDLRLKLAIARRILPVTADARYVDVSVPERPVAGYGAGANPQVEG